MLLAETDFMSYSLLFGGVRVCGPCVLSHLHPLSHDQHLTCFSVYHLKSVCVHMDQWALRSMTSRDDWPLIRLLPSLPHFLHYPHLHHYPHLLHYPCLLPYPASFTTPTSTTPPPLLPPPPSLSSPPSLPPSPSLLIAAEFVDAEFKKFIRHNQLLLPNLCVQGSP